MTENEPIVWMSVNLKEGGTKLVLSEPPLRRQGLLGTLWLRRLPTIVRLSRRRPDVIFIQEAVSFDHYGAELLHAVERWLREAKIGAYRGFLTRSTRSRHHQAIFIDSVRLEPVHHWTGAEGDESRGLYGFVHVIVDGDERRTILLKSIHLDPGDGDGRLSDVKQIHAAVIHDQPDGQRVLIAGDYNSITSRRTAEQGEPQPNFVAMPAAARYGKGVWPPTLPNGDTTPDTRALDYLLDCGWECQHINDGNTTPTTTPNYERGGELIIDRALTFGGLTTVPGSVWVDKSKLSYSDHRACGGWVTITDRPAA